MKGKPRGKKDNTPEPSASGVPTTTQLVVNLGSLQKRLSNHRLKLYSPQFRAKLLQRHPLRSVHQK